MRVGLIVLCAASILVAGCKEPGQGAGGAPHEKAAAALGKVSDLGEYTSALRGLAGQKDATLKAVPEMRAWAELSGKVPGAGGRAKELASAVDEIEEQSKAMENRPEALADALDEFVAKPTAGNLKTLQASLGKFQEWLAPNKTALATATKVKDEILGIIKALPGTDSMKDSATKILAPMLDAHEKATFIDSKTGEVASALGAR